MIGSYPSPAGGEEYAVRFDRSRSRRLLVLPALFAEANALRHFTVEVLRALDRLEIDTFLPDLPGCNESLARLTDQGLVAWRAAAAAAGSHFRATATLTIRAGVLCEPPGALPALRYVPITGASVLRSLIRARLVASREAGQVETADALMGRARTDGIELAGYGLGAQMVRDLEVAEPAPRPDARTILQGDIGGAGLWLRAEPAHDPEQARALASRVADALG